MEKPTYEEAIKAKAVLLAYLEGLIDYKSSEEIERNLQKVILYLALKQEYNI